MSTLSCPMCGATTAKFIEGLGQKNWGRCGDCGWLYIVDSDVRNTDDEYCEVNGHTPDCLHNLV